MLTVKSFTKRQTKDGREFLTLELVGGLQMMQSSNTGKWYGTVQTVNIPVTFSDEVASTLVGTQMPGQIIRVQCDPYTYTVKATGEVVTLQHQNVYEPTPGGKVVMQERELATM